MIFGFFPPFFQIWISSLGIDLMIQSNSLVNDIKLIVLNLQFAVGTFHEQLSSLLEPIQFALRFVQA